MPGRYKILLIFLLVVLGALVWVKISEAMTVRDPGLKYMDLFQPP